MCKELQEYDQAGLFLLLDGSPSSPKEIARACGVCEENSYMRDYIRDESDALIGIGFDRVKKK